MERESIARKSLRVKANSRAWECMREALPYISERLIGNEMILVCQLETKTETERQRRDDKPEKPNC